MFCSEVAGIPHCDVLTNQPIIEYMMLYVWCLRSDYIYVLRSLESQDSLNNVAIKEEKI